MLAPGHAERKAALVLASVLLLGTACAQSPHAVAVDAPGLQGGSMTRTGSLPEAPSATLEPPAVAQQSMQQAWPMQPCPAIKPADSAVVGDGSAVTSATPCVAPPRQPDLRTVVNSNQRKPLTAEQKGLLAFRSYTDPFNFVAIGFESGIAVADNAHSPYGPGFKGFGRLYGYSLVEDATGGFFGTFLIPAIAHEDPRYRREEGRPIRHRIWHALSRTAIAEHDDGRKMPNYATLLNYPIGAEIANLYIPGVQGNGPATAKRIGLGLATDPIGNFIAEFLPDIARRVHVRSILVQQIINQMAFGNPNGPPQ